MQTCKLWLVLDDTGSNVFLHGLTPGDVAIMRKVHANRAGLDRPCLVDAEYEGEVSIEDYTGYLLGRYGRPNFEKAFPGDSPSLPTTFTAIKMDVKGLPQPKPVVPVKPAVVKPPVEE